MEFDGDGGFLMAVGSSLAKVRYHSSQLIKKIAFCKKKKKSLLLLLIYHSVHFYSKKKKNKKQNISFHNIRSCWKCKSAL